MHAFPLDLAALAPIAPPPGFHEAAEALHVAFEPGDLDRLGKYLAALLAANEVMNLTAVRDADTAWTRHILDSLTLLGPLSELADGSKIIDVGSGGGLPGIPLAICLPHLSFTLLEATGKKAEFLRAVAAALGLANVTVEAFRAEVLAHDRGTRAGDQRVGGHREAYDAVIARAVGRLAVVAELTVPFARPSRAGEAGGFILLMKGERAEEELHEAAPALDLLKAVHVGTIEVGQTRIVVLEKRSATPKTFPRADGEPARSPLGVGAPAKPKPHTKPHTKPATTRPPDARPPRGDRADH